MSNHLAGQDLQTRILECIGQHLLQVESIYQQELASSTACVNDVFAHVSRFQGKRLRPNLLLLTAAATGGVNSQHETLAAVVEMIHTATLVHDDVLDDAETRRHVATVNARWNTETSVLFGDYLFTHAFHLASSLETTLACRLIGRATNRVCEGELTQIHERGNLDLTEERYIEIVDGKTAELCALCCYLGAHFAEAEPTTVEAMERYGRALGIAFQISDDILDISGDEETTGKSLGSDFRKQKLTLPVIRLLNQSSPEDKTALKELLAAADEPSWQKLWQHLKKSDAITYAKQRAVEYAQSARDELNSLNDSPALKILQDLADFAIQRAY